MTTKEQNQVICTPLVITTTETRRHVSRESPGRVEVAEHEEGCGDMVGSYAGEPTAKKRQKHQSTGVRLGRLWVASPNRIRSSRMMRDVSDRKAEPEDRLQQASIPSTNHNNECTELCTYSAQLRHE